MKYIVLKSVIILSLLLFITNKAVFAHPHVFIAQKLTIELDKKGVAGFGIHWEFDELFSSMICEDHDLNKNGILEKTEVASIREKAFFYISEFNYFIYIKIDGAPFPVSLLKSFSGSDY